MLVSFDLESLPTRVRTILVIDAVLSQGHFFSFNEDYGDAEEQNREIIEKRV